MPFFIFLDVNVPASERLDFDSGWIGDLKEALSTEPSKETPDVFTAIFATNFAGHYADGDETTVRSEWVSILSQHPRLPASAQAVRIAQTLERYAKIPREV